MYFGWVLCNHVLFLFLRYVQGCFRRRCFGEGLRKTCLRTGENEEKKDRAKRRKKSLKKMLFLSAAVYVKWTSTVHGGIH